MSISTEQINQAGSEIVKAIEHPVNFQNKNTLPIEHGHKSLLFITDFVYRLTLQHNTKYVYWKDFLYSKKYILLPFCTFMFSFEASVRYI